MGNVKPVVFGNKENDLAFIVDDALYIMMEEQSYFCANIAYRILEYIVAALRSTIDSEKTLYGSKLVRFPMPKLYVVNVGLIPERQKPERVFYDIELEDSFIPNGLGIESDLKLTVHVIDFRMTPEETLKYIEDYVISERLIIFSEELFQYALTANCITYVRLSLKHNSRYKKPKNIDSVAEVLELLRDRGVLYELLRQKEVFDMTMATFSRDDILIYHGIELGREEGILNMLCIFLQNGGTKEEARKLLNATDEQISMAEKMLIK